MSNGLQRELKQNRPFVTVQQEAAVALMRTADLMRRSLTTVVEPHGITLQQYNVLRILRGAGAEGLPTLEIAERMIEQTPGITRLIDRLEMKRLVFRQRCGEDRRRVWCRITPEGLQLLARLDDPIRESEKEVLSELSERQLAQLISLLERARSGLHAALSARREELTQLIEEAL
jgi:DNA-binding MarR family transcriptional regulator